MIISAVEFPLLDLGLKNYKILLEMYATTSFLSLQKLNRRRLEETKGICECCSEKYNSYIKDS